MSRIGTVAFWMVGLVGCALDGGQSGEEGARCEASSSTTLARDEVSPLGFTPAEVLAFTEGTHVGELVWADGPTTDVTVSVTFEGGSIAFVDYEVVTDDGAEPAAEIGCADLVEVEERVAVVSADGAFDESFTVVLGAASADAMTGVHALDDVNGTFTVGDHVDVSDYDAVSAWLDLRFDASGSSGTVAAQGTIEGDPDDPESTSSATNLDVGAWAPAAP